MRNRSEKLYTPLEAMMLKANIDRRTASERGNRQIIKLVSTNHDRLKKMKETFTNRGPLPDTDGSTLTPDFRFTPPDRGSVCIVPATAGRLDFDDMIRGIYNRTFLALVAVLFCGCLDKFDPILQFQEMTLM